MSKIRKSETKIILEDSIGKISALEELIDSKYPLFNEQVVRRYKVGTYGSIDIILDMFYTKGIIVIDKEVHKYLSKVRYNNSENIHEFLINFSKNMEKENAKA